MAKLQDTKIIDALLQGPLRAMESLERQIFCQRVEQYWGDVVRPFLPIGVLYTMSRFCAFGHHFGFLLKRI